MGRRKSSRLNRPVKRPMPKLDTVFRCPFCQHEASVGCSFNKALNIGEIACSICQANFVTSLTPLTEPIDIYSEWIDACEQVNTNRDHRYIKPELNRRVNNIDSGVKDEYSLDGYIKL